MRRKVYGLAAVGNEGERAFDRIAGRGRVAPCDGDYADAISKGHGVLEGLVARLQRLQSVADVRGQDVLALAQRLADLDRERAKRRELRPERRAAVGLVRPLGSYSLQREAEGADAAR